MSFINDLRLPYFFNETKILTKVFSSFFLLPGIMDCTDPTRTPQVSDGVMKLSDNVRKVSDGDKKLQVGVRKSDRLRQEGDRFCEAVVGWCHVGIR